MAKKSAPKNKDIKNKVDDKKTEDIVENINIPKTYDMFARNKDYGFVAMTKEASMMSDDSVKKNKSELPSKISSCIHKIRENK